MALDTANKRFSMMGDIVPIPDGTIDEGDRYQWLGLYRFDLGVVPFQFTQGFVLEIAPRWEMGLER